MIKFEFDELIEVSDRPDFQCVTTIRFMVDFRDTKHDWVGGYPICGIDKWGHSVEYKFARKIEPTVIVCFNGISREIPKSLADKIMSGEV